METVFCQADCTPYKILIVLAKPTKILLTFVFCWLFCLPVLRAGHIVGGEFTYICRGWQNDDPNTGVRVYDVRINMYRDNIGQGAYFDGLFGGVQGPAPFDNTSLPGHINIFRGQSNVAQQIIQLGDVSPVPINLGNPCLVLTEPADQQIGIYEFSIELPVSTEPYTLAYQRCCRNTAILNLVDPGNIGSTYFITITPEAQQRCNASPVFNIDPPIAICVNQPFQIDFGATDRESDSLAYKFCDPVVGGGNNAPMAGTTSFDDVAPDPESPPPYAPARFVNPRFNSQDQLGIGSLLSLDESTGLLRGNPNFRGTYALAVCIEEWSRDAVPVLLSETKREFQLVVNLCGTRVNADLLETEIDEFGRFYIRQCGPGENTIVNESTDEMFIDTYDWSLDGPDGEITGNDRDLPTNITQVGVYEGTMILNRNTIAENCRDTATFLLGVFPPLEADFEYVEPGCDDEPVPFTNLSTVAGSNVITEYSWEFEPGADPTLIENPNHRFSRPGEFPVTLSITDNNECAAAVTKPVVYFPSPRTIIIEPDDGFGCVPFNKTFVNLSRPISDEYIFDWRFGDGGTGEVASPTHVYEEAGIYSVYLGITSPTGCFVERDFIDLVDVRDAPTAEFSWTPDRITNFNPDISFTDESIDAARVRYTLENSQGERIFTTPARDFEYTLRDTGTIAVTQLVTHPSGCVDTILKNLELVFENTFFVPNAFTPNADGRNDIFLPKGVLFGSSNYEFRVWTRWGELVFTSNDPALGWDGRYKGSDSPGGGYLWDASFINAEGGQERFKGGVVLLR